LAAGDFLVRHGLGLGIGVVAVVVATIFGARTRRGRVLVDAVALHTPGVAGLYRTSVLTRCTRTLGLLLQAGVPLHQALEHTCEVAGSDAYRRLWLNAHRLVMEGRSLLEAVSGRPLFGSAFEQLVAAGEATARLDQVMQKVATQQSRDLERRIKDLLTVLEPLMVVMMAGVVGFVALSIMMPIFKMSRG
jgi:type IV pilus assembly protein PilC